MAAPRAVQEQLERAEQLHREQYTPDTEQAQAEDEGNEQQQEAPQVNAAPDENQETLQEQSQGDEFGNAEEAESWEERFRKLEAAHKTLQGKYRAEVPMIAEENRKLRAQLSEANAKKVEAEQQTREAEGQVSELMERLREEVGEDSSSVIAEYTNQVINSKLEELKKTQQNDEPEPNPEWDRFLTSIRSRIPDFDEINNSPEFIQWLNDTPDDVTGMTLQDALTQAGKSLDAFAVVDITRQFLNQKQSRAQQHREGQQRSVPNREDYVSPNRQQAPQSPPPRQTYTPNDFAKLQDEYRQGLWKGKEAEFRAREQEIFAALS